MNLSFKNRIALHYMLATATITTVVFVIIYFVAQTAMYQEIDSDLTFEAHMHQTEIFVRNDSILFINKNEWMEREHIEVQANPVFIQIVDNKGALMDKSPNLKQGNLRFNDHQGFYTQFNTQLNNKAIRQIQVPVEKDGVLQGYIMAAMSLEGAIIVLHNLRKTLFILLPIVLIGLFFITRLLAGRSIIPVQTITQTADRITRNSLNERISLPANKDELFTLTSSINQLLDRMQDAIEREKQFTADASHQLRTPLAVLKGTLEVLIRKPRNSEEYEEKISSSIQEINRISEVVEQLLILARFDKSSQLIAQQSVNLQTALDDVLHRYRVAILDENLSVNVQVSDSTEVLSNPYYLDLILDNLLSNAIKYSLSNATIDLAIFTKNNQICCQIKDNGIGIDSKDLNHIFNPFYRSNPLQHKEIIGNGLGLSIVKKSCMLLGIDIFVESELSKGSCFLLVFSK